MSINRGIENAFGEQHGHKQDKQKKERRDGLEKFSAFLTRTRIKCINVNRV